MLQNKSFVTKIFNNIISLVYESEWIVTPANLMPRTIHRITILYGNFWKHKLLFTSALCFTRFFLDIFPEFIAHSGTTLTLMPRVLFIVTGLAEVQNCTTAETITQLYISFTILISTFTINQHKQYWPIFIVSVLQIL